jgi:hypothetical protein
MFRLLSGLSSPLKQLSHSGLSDLPMSVKLNPALTDRYNLRSIILLLNSILILLLKEARPLRIAIETALTSTSLRY